MNNEEIKSKSLEFFECISKINCTLAEKRITKGEPENIDSIKKEIKILLSQFISAVDNQREIEEIIIQQTIDSAENIRDFLEKL